jgi:hypothetical protein
MGHITQGAFYNITEDQCSFLLREVIKGLVWELKYWRELEGLKSPSYSKLNKKGILAPLIPSGFKAPKLSPKDAMNRRDYWNPGITKGH